MARITLVQKARKDQGNCESCGDPIVAGTSYRWCAPGGIGARKRKRHATCPVWRPSELSSSKMATAWAAHEDAEAALSAVRAQAYITVDETTKIPEFDSSGFVDEVRSIVNDVASSAEEVATDYQDGIDALPEQLQYGPTAEESQEKISALEEWASTLEGFDPSDDWDNDGALETLRSPEDDDDAEPDLDAFNDAVEEWAENVISEAEDALNEFDY